MHILHVTPYFPPTWSYGGIPRVVDALARAQHVLEAKVSVITTDAYSDEERANVPWQRDYEGVSVHTLPNISNRLAFSQQLFLPNHTTAVLSTLSKIDIIHLHGHRHLLNTAAAKWARANSIPYVMTANGTLKRHERKRRFKWFWDHLFAGHIPPNAECCIAVSGKDVQQHLDYGIEKKRIHCIANGLDLNQFENLPETFAFNNKQSQDAPILTYLGQLSPRKGVDHLIESFSALNHPTAWLMIAGNNAGSYGQYLRKTTTHPRIQFTGVLRGPTRLKLLQQSDGVIYPSKDEIFGLVPFEALMCGTPVIVGNDSGCGELIREANAGMLVPYGDTVALSTALSTLLSASDKMKVLVANGQQYTRRFLCSEHIAQQHLRLYKRIISSNGDAS